MVNILFILFLVFYISQFLEENSISRFFYLSLSGKKTSLFLNIIVNCS